MMGKSADSLKELGPPTDWELVDRIGEGTYGEVFTARNKISGEIAAAKVIDSIHEKIEEVLPEVVAERPDGTLAVKYDRIIPLLIQAIKELKNGVS